MAERSQGLFILKKIEKEHVDLTSYSKMRVNLAAEVSWFILKQQQQQHINVTV